MFPTDVSSPHSIFHGNWLSVLLVTPLSLDRAGTNVHFGGETETVVTPSYVKCHMIFGRYTNHMTLAPKIAVIIVKLYLLLIASSSSSIFNVNIISPTSRGDFLRQLFHQCDSVYHV